MQPPAYFQCNSLGLWLFGHFRVPSLVLIAAIGGIAGLCTVRGSELVHDRYLGVQTCQSSGCHGGAGIEHNQSIVWRAEDYHARAFAILTTSRSSRIADSLHIADATKNVRCTICHSPFQTLPSRMLAKTASPAEGVSCESCHAPAENWIRAHTRQDYTHADCVAAGVRDLRNLYVRANSCVACHEAISPELLDAGHPALRFELASQTELEPPHWREPDSYKSVNAWLIGQAAALRELSWHLCKDEARTAPEMLSRWDALCWLLRKVAAQDPSLPKLPPAEPKPSYAAVQRIADEMARAAGKTPISATVSECLLVKLSQTGAELSNASQNERAENAYERAIALVAAFDQLTRTALIDSKPELAASLKLMHDDLATPAAFGANAFASHLDTFKNECGKLPPK